MNAASSTAITPPPPVTTTADAEALIGHLLDVMDALLAKVDEETELVRGGRLAEAAQLQTSKSDLARLYIADVLRLKGSRDCLARLASESLAELHQRHDAFRALLQINLTVVATAQAVSEGILRGVSGEMTRKHAPQTYGASGRHNAPGAGASQPLAVSRSL